MFNHIHFLGILGAGMIPLVYMSKDIGVKYITGTDISFSGEKNIDLIDKIFTIHNKENISKTVDALVYSSAISSDVEEIYECKFRNIPILHRSDLLNIYIKLHNKSIMISGTHGKSSTTSIIAQIYKLNNIDVSYYVGADTSNIELLKYSGYISSSKDIIIFEADESDGTITKYNPSLSLILNIDYDHKNYYTSFSYLLSTFLCIFKNTEDFIIKNPYIRDLNSEKELPIKINNKFDPCNKEDLYLSISDNQYSLSTISGIYIPDFYRDKRLIINMILIVRLSLYMNLKIDNIFKKVKFPKRRLEFKGSVDNIIVYDDYGHHPTAIRTTLNILRTKYPNKKITTIFQPLRYSRSILMKEEFKSLFNEIDNLILMDIYAASEINNNNLTLEGLFGKTYNYISDDNLLIKYLLKNLNENDLLLTIGANNGYIGELFIERKNLIINNI